MRSEFGVQAPFIETQQTPAPIHLSFPKRLFRLNDTEDTLLPICLGYHVRRFTPTLKAFKHQCAVPKMPVSNSSGANYKTALLSLSALSTTVSEDSAIAAPANIGDIKIPNVG
jgi:hypothetical protein